MRLINKEILKWWDNGDGSTEISSRLQRIAGQEYLQIKNASHDDDCVIFKTAIYKCQFEALINIICKAYILRS